MSLRPTIPAKKKAAAPPPRTVRTTQIRRPAANAVSATATSFKFVPRSREFVQRTLSRPKGKFDSIFKSGFDITKLREGNNTIRILPQTWTEEEAHYSYQVWAHRFIGPNNSTFLCRERMLNESCPACDAWRELAAQGDDDAWKAGPQERFITWVLHKESENPLQPSLWDNSRTQDDEILSRTNPVDGSVIYPEDPDQGFDLYVRRVGTNLNTKYTGHDFARAPSPINEDPQVMADILEYIVQNPIPECLHYHTAEYMQRVVFGNVEQADPELDAQGDEPAADEDEPAAAPARRPVRQARAEPEPEEEEVVEEDAAPEDEAFDPETGELVEGYDEDQPADEEEPPFDEDEPAVDEEPEPEPEPAPRRPAPRPAARAAPQAGRNGPRPVAAKSVIRRPAAQPAPTSRPATAKPAVRPAARPVQAAKPAARPVAGRQQQPRRTYRD